MVGIFPEATISRSFELKELEVRGDPDRRRRQASRSFPVVLWGTQRLMTKDHPRDFSRDKTIGIQVGEPMYPTGDGPGRGDPRSCTTALQVLLDEAIDAYPAQEQPPGSWWLPASRGGSAPTRRSAPRSSTRRRRPPGPPARASRSRRGRRPGRG